MNDLWKTDFERELKALEHRPWVTQLGDDPRHASRSNPIRNAIARVTSGSRQLVIARFTRPKTAPDINIQPNR
jgi:hypothetical protein